MSWLKNIITKIVRSIQSLSLEKIGAIIAIFSAIVSFSIGAITRYETYFAQHIPQVLGHPIVQFIWDYRYPIFFVSMTSLYIVAYYYHQRKTIELGRRIDASSATIGRLASAVRQNIELVGETRKQLELREFEAALTLVRTGLTASCTQLAAIFTEITENPCHVCLKRYDPSNRKVTTIIRDVPPVSYLRYEQNTLDYDVDKNTALHSTLNLNDPVFFSNNLHEVQNYQNHSKDWHKWYNATVVITFPPNRVNPPANTRGFLCIDNMGGGFDQDTAVPILEMFASIYFDIIDLYEETSGRVFWET